MKTLLKPLTHQFLFEESGYTAEMCIEQESLEIAYHLRYRAYVNVDAISPNTEQLCTDKFDEQQNARTYLIWYEGQPVASVRSLSWSAAYQWAPTPSVQLFSAEIDQQLGLSASLLESNRYVVAPDFTGRPSLTAQMLLFRVQTLAAIADHCDHVITAVRPRHVRFYERFMNFRVISEAIEVSEVKFPIQLLTTPVSSKEKLAQSSGIAAYQEIDLERYMHCLKHLKKHLL